MFAEQGLEHVSLRQITSAAKQKNTSALHYHFGSRQNLIEAIFSLRMSRINERRMEMLMDLERKGTAIDLRAVVAARVNPLAERLMTPEGPDYYVRFLAQANLSPQLDVAAFIRGRFDEGLIRSSRLIRQILPDIPRRVLEQRLALSGSQMVYALAEWQQKALRSGNGVSTSALNRFGDNLISFIQGGLSAPAAPHEVEERRDAAAARKGAVHSSKRKAPTRRKATGG